MALKDKVNTAKEVLANTKSRMVVILLGVIVVVVLVIAYVKFKRSELPPAGMGSEMVGVPAIKSIPGLGSPTREYAKLQEQQNIELAEEAARKGTAAIPTVVRTTYLDIGVSGDLSQQAGATSAAGCGVEELKRARAAGVTVLELRCRGCSLAALKAAGFTAGELRAAGFSAQELRDAGFSAAELKNAGFSANELAASGFSAKELANVGYTAGELKDAGFSAADLEMAGFSASAIKATGLGSTNISSTGECNVEKLRAARNKGVSAVELKKRGCSAAALRAAGYTAAELKAAGFSAKELKDAGFSANDLRAAGFSAKDLRDAGFSAKDLKNAGFSAEDLKAAGFSAGELRNAGFSAEDLKNAGFGADELRAAGFSATELSEAGFTPDDLKKAGYTQGDLVRAGVAISGGEVGIDTCSVENLKKARASGVKASVLRKRGCSAAALKAAGFTNEELQDAGYTKAEIGIVTEVSKPSVDECSVENLKKVRKLGITAASLKQRGCGVAVLKEAGFSAADLYARGFAPDELKAIGYDNNEVNAAKLLVDSSRGMEPSGLPTVLGRMSEAQIAGMSDEEINNFIRQQQAMMMTQAGQLFAAWSQVPSQVYIKGEVVDTKKAQAKEEAECVTKEQETIDLKKFDVYKAGDIIFAVLDTEVNSDETAPVMATVIQGPLQGAKVLGNFRRVAEKVLLQFSVLSIPKLDKSIAINAVAIDPNTAKTALASSVDNHYMLRYGTLFASSFMSGLGEAFQNAGGKVETTNVGTVSTMPDLKTTEKLIVAFGQMANAFSEATRSKINTPPTVKLNAGVGIGLLLMADLAVPKVQK